MEVLIYEGRHPRAKLCLTDQFPGREGVPTVFHEYLSSFGPGGATVLSIDAQCPSMWSTPRVIISAWLTQPKIASGKWGPVTPAGERLAKKFLNRKRG